MRNVHVNIVTVIWRIFHDKNYVHLFIFYKQSQGTNMIIVQTGAVWKLHSVFLSPGCSLPFTHFLAFSLPGACGALLEFVNAKNTTNTLLVEPLECDIEPREHLRERKRERMSEEDGERERKLVFGECFPSVCVEAGASSELPRTTWERERENKTETSEEEWQEAHTHKTTM